MREGSENTICSIRRTTRLRAWDELDLPKMYAARRMSRDHIAGAETSGQASNFFDQTFDLACIIDSDHFVCVNQRWVESLGWSEDHLFATPWLELVHPDDREATRERFAAVEGGTPVVGFENRHSTTTGRWQRLSWSARFDPVSGHTYASAREVIPGERRIEFAPLATSSAVRAVLESDDLSEALLAIGTAVHNLKPGATVAFYGDSATHGNLVEINAKTLAEGAVLPRERCLALVHGVPHTTRPSASADQRCGHLSSEATTICLPIKTATEEFGLLSVSIPASTPDGSSEIDSEGNPVLPRLENVSVALAEIAVKNALSRRALTDALTGLANRAALNQEVNRMLASTRSQDIPFAVIMLDLDHFKEVNDTLGHQAGDDVLVAAARRMSGAVRDGDRVARLGGDEFGVLLPTCDAVSLAVICERMRVAISSAPPELRHGTTASIGGVVIRDRSTTWEEIYSAADAILYAAKKAGRDQFQISDGVAVSG